LLPARQRADDQRLSRRHGCPDRSVSPADASKVCRSFNRGAAWKQKCWRNGLDSDSKPAAALPDLQASRASMSQLLF